MEGRFMLVQGYTIVGCYDTLEEAKKQPFSSYLGSKWYIIDLEAKHYELCDTGMWEKPGEVVAQGTLGTE